MKKTIAVILAVLSMVMCFAGCGESAKLVKEFEVFVQANPYDCSETEYLVDVKLINEYKNWLEKLDEAGITATETPYYTYAELIVSLEEYISVNDFVELVHKADESFRNGYDEFVKGSDAISSDKYDAASAAFLNAVNYFDRASGIAYAYDQEAEYVASYAECMDNLSTDAANFSVAVLLRSNDLLNKAKVSIMGHIAIYGMYSVEASNLVEEVAGIKLQIQEALN